MMLLVVGWRKVVGSDGTQDGDVVILATQALGIGEEANDNDSTSGEEGGGRLPKEEVVEAQAFGQGMGSGLYTKE